MIFITYHVIEFTLLTTLASAGLVLVSLRNQAIILFGIYSRGALSCTTATHHVLRLVQRLTWHRAWIHRVVVHRATIHGIELHLLLLQLLLSGGLFFHLAALLLLDLECLFAQALHNLLVVHHLGTEVFAGLIIAARIFIMIIAVFIVVNIAC